MKIYDFKQAPNPRRVRIFLAEKGISVPLEQIDIFQRANRQPPFLAKNPLGGIPVLELDDGTCIAESIAICRYFEALASGAAAVRPRRSRTGAGRDVEPARRARAAERDRHGLDPRPPADREASCSRSPRTWSRTASARRDFLELLDRELGTRAFVAGERISVADISALCAIDFARMVEIAPDPSLKNVARWHEAMSARPSAQA